MMLVHTWEATEKFLSALLAPLKQNADLENMLKVTKWVENLAHPLCYSGYSSRSASVHALDSSPLLGHSIIKTREGRVLEILSSISF